MTFESTKKLHIDLKVNRCYTTNNTVFQRTSSINGDVRFLLEEATKHYHKNPRQITKKQFDLLSDTLAELGDLSGIVHDLNSDEIVGGNMRSDVFNVNLCEIELTHRGDTPDEQGTVAHGFIVWNGKRYAYRQVRWTAKQCEKANVIANKVGGTWDFDILADQFQLDDLLTWGFEPHEFGLDGDELPTEFKEYDESVADDVEMCTCPQCGHSFPK